MNHLHSATPATGMRFPNRGSALLSMSLGVLLFVVVGDAAANTFPLPPGNDALIGQLEETDVRQGDTLLDIARRHGLGLNEIIAANPGVDPWLPEVGRKILLPMQFILPDAPREGIIVNLPEMRLYYYPATHPGETPHVITHPLGIGAEGKAIPLLSEKITEKKYQPTWIVPESIRAEHAAEGDFLPKIIPPGPDNPLGDYALRLGGTNYLIHGTNRPFSIGMRVSHGCLRMYPEDIETFYHQVPSGTPVRIINQPHKAGWSDEILYLESHPAITELEYSDHHSLTPMVRAVASVTDGTIGNRSWNKATTQATAASGIPTAIYPLMPLTMENLDLPEGTTVQREWMTLLETKPSHDVQPHPHQEHQSLLENANP